MENPIIPIVEDVTTQNGDNAEVIQNLQDEPEVKRKQLNKRKPLRKAKKAKGGEEKTEQKNKGETLDDHQQNLPKKNEMPEPPFVTEKCEKVENVETIETDDKTTLEEKIEKVENETIEEPPQLTLDTQESPEPEVKRKQLNKRKPLHKAKKTKKIEEMKEEHNDVIDTPAEHQESVPEHVECPVEQVTPDRTEDKVDHFNVEPAVVDNGLGEEPEVKRKQLNKRKPLHKAKKTKQIEDTTKEVKEVIQQGEEQHESQMESPLQTLSTEHIDGNEKVETAVTQIVEDVNVQHNENDVTVQRVQDTFDELEVKEKPRKQLTRKPLHKTKKAKIAEEKADIPEGVLDQHETPSEHVEQALLVEPQVTSELVEKPVDEKHDDDGKLEKGEKPKKKKKTKKTKKQVKEVLPTFPAGGANTYLRYISDEDCNLSGLRRGKKGLIGDNYFDMKKGNLTAEEMMEDEHYCALAFNGDEHKNFFGIFDGYSGVQAAFETKKILPGILEDLLKENYESKDLLEKCFERVDKKLMEKDELDCIGCTCTIVYVWEEDGEMYVQSGNVGDSTCFVKKFNGSTPEIITLSQDHKVSSPCEQKRIVKSGIAMVEGQRRICGVSVARSLANKFVKSQNLGMIGTPYISPVVMLEKGDEIIMSSDGIWDVTSPEIAFQLLEENEFEKGARNIIDHSIKVSECRDNLTVIAVKVL
ncbi:kinase associated protein phosphatase, putative [Entamoeba invadens IP1]|uniref:Kinase associated protein phosphatase, putative n=1 Tax=Entamoeba invadens IP1 TaxID=370355 RepID=A0A0A1U616_ENTIV|nr:kinase associated protein phosphatase, putative [Entamoeba invadens IP1]ELP87276.1 kinase associated protein phosphatase, putative [Entamoeba invadens IP1]|eukprot:XP_004254047.1 kinase associated protein phosphatase, putative [Entamoeba invadens IP1]